MIGRLPLASRPALGRAYIAVLAALVSLTGSCSGGGGDKTTAPVIVAPVLTTLSVSLSPTSVVLGQTATATASGFDQNGASISTGAVSWGSGAPAIASVSAAGVVSGVAAGQASITATAGGKQGLATLTVTLPPVATVNVTPPSATIALAATVQLTATTVDGSGATLSGRTVVWSSSDATKATVSTAGLVTGITSGIVTISATSDGKTGTASVSVAPAPIATITLAPATSTIAIGGTTAFTATAKDVSGNTLSGRTLVWSTSSAAVASGTASGNVYTVTGVSAGSATVTATGEGKTGTATVTVTAIQVAITTVTPATLVPGASVVITGAGFSATASANTVTIGGVAATVTAATSTQLSVTMSSSYPCLATGNATVSVIASGVTATKQQTLQVASSLALSVGQAASFLDAQSIRCNELSQTGGRYLISIFNSSTTPSANASLTFNGATSTATSASAAVALPVRESNLSARPSRSPAEVALDVGRRDHGAQLDRNRQIYAQMRADPAIAAARAERRAAARSGGLSTAGVTVPLTVGSKVVMHYIPASSTSCNTFVNVTARVVNVTSHGIVLEDTASVTAGLIDPELSALGQLFENSLYPIEATFGNINADDVSDALNNPGRVVMLFTPQQNVPSSNGGITLGHVISCDFAPTALAGYGGSNQTKIFYARAPTSTSTNANTTDTKGWWNAKMPGTLVHEAKHLTSYAERSSRNATAFEESWLEEATAQIATEIYGRSVYTSSSWKGNATYANTVYCDARIGFAQCPSGVFVMQSHFLYLYDYFRNNESKSILSPGSQDGDIYGSAWMFARWLVDQYGGATESTLLQALVQEPTLAGVANVTAKTGFSWSTLLADWTMMLVADDYPGYTPPVGAKYTFPSWNMRSIWSGFNTDFPSSFVAFPLIDRAISFGAFSVPLTLSGSATSIFELSGTQSTKQLLDLSTLSSSTLIRMSILRVQ
jgi:uncharacterized protein YjdB